MATTKTIGNPLSWLAQRFHDAGHHLSEAHREIAGVDAAPPKVRTMHMADIGAALRLGWEDFKACRTDVMFLVLIYPVIGLALITMAFKGSLIPLLFPLVAGFALLGPAAAVGLYELSRQREAGATPRWSHALAVVESPGFGGVLLMAVYLIALFLAWIVAASVIHRVTMGADMPQSITAFARDVLTTPGGWVMIVVGFAVGFCFALAALAVSVVSFPLLLDRHVGAPRAVATSVQVLRQNPRVVLGWGALVAALLAIGAIPLLLGLIIVLPVLGHASWHLYRRAIA